MHSFIGSMVISAFIIEGLSVLGEQVSMTRSMKSLLACIHTDGHHGSCNIHVHIVINSLRKNDVERQDFMARDRDSRAGNRLTALYQDTAEQSLRWESETLQPPEHSKSGQ